MKTFKLLLTAIALLFVQWANAQYCTPTFPISGNCGALMSLTTTGADVNLSYIPNNAGLKPNAVVGSQIVAKPGQEISLNLHITTFWAYAHLFLDFNGDGQFDSSELVGKYGDLVGRTYFNESTGVKCLVDGKEPKYIVPFVEEGTILKIRVINGNTSVDGGTPNPCIGWREGSYCDFEIKVSNPVFEKISLNASTNGSYTITNKAGNVVEHDSEVSVGSQLTVNTAPADGYQVKKIEVNGEAIVGNTFTFTGASTVDVSFTSDIFITLPTPANFTLSVKDGANADVVNGAYLPNGESLTVTITPAMGYELSLFSVNGDDKLSQLVDGVLELANCQSNLTIVATAVKKKFAITYVAPLSGTGTLTVRNETAAVNVPTGGLAEYGSTIVISAKASIISTFSSLKVNGVERNSEVIADKLSITLTEDLTIEATFLATMYDLSWTHSGNGAGMVNCFNSNTSDSEVSSGDRIVKSHYLFFEIMPEAGSTVTSIKINEVEQDLTEENSELEKYADHWVLWFEMNRNLEFKFEFSDPNSVLKTKDEVAIDFDIKSAALTIPNGASATIIDLTGAVVRTVSVSHSSLESLPSGVYIVRVFSEVGRKSIKIIKK